MNTAREAERDDQPAQEPEICPRCPVCAEPMTDLYPKPRCKKCGYLQSCCNPEFCGSLKSPASPGALNSRTDCEAR